MEPKKPSPAEKLLEGMKFMSFPERIRYMTMLREAGINLSEELLKEEEDLSQCMCNTLQEEREPKKDHKIGCPLYK